MLSTVSVTVAGLIKTMINDDHFITRPVDYERKLPLLFLSI